MVKDWKIKKTLRSLEGRKEMSINRIVKNVKIKS
jgi:hypothetical protein